MSDVSIDPLTLQAYVDNELDASESARIQSQIDADPLLAEQVASLQHIQSLVKASFHSTDANDTNCRQQALAMLEASNAATHNATETQHRSTGTRRLAMAASLVAGLIGGYGAAGLLRSDPAAQDWIAQVANYQEMYTHATLAHVPNANEPAMADMLARLQSALGAPLQVPTLDRHALDFKRGQILTSNGQALIQLAYLHRDSGTPFALCITRTGQAEPIKQMLEGQSHGMNYVAWTDGEFNLVAIGDLDRAILLDAAQSARQQSPVPS